MRDLWSRGVTASYAVCVNNEAQIFSEKILAILGLTKVPIEFIREISDETNQ